MRSAFTAFMVGLLLAGVARAADDEPDLIFRKSTTFKMLTPNAVIGSEDSQMAIVRIRSAGRERDQLETKLDIGKISACRADLGCCKNNIAVWPSQRRRACRQQDHATHAVPGLGNQLQ